MDLCQEDSRKGSTVPNSIRLVISFKTSLEERKNENQKPKNKHQKVSWLVHVRVALNSITSVGWCGSRTDSKEKANIVNSNSPAYNSLDLFLLYSYVLREIRQ
uniref:Uncharacterized protein n=1 Tax=Onchocerca volvulus TaxID=6282 RepID=A0A8R1XNZ7_ONCVO